MASINDDINDDLYKCTLGFAYNRLSIGLAGPGLSRNVMVGLGS